MHHETTPGGGAGAGTGTGTGTGPPAGEPALKTVAMPGDANPNGDIFGGWVMAQMDLAGAVPAVRRARGRVATVAVEGMRFHKPVFVGDLVSCYAELVKVGRSSVTVRVETWAERRIVQERVKVTEGVFVYVAIDDEGGKRPLPEPA
jgi:acyl-CoA thioesterase YciA